MTNTNWTWAMAAGTLLALGATSNAQVAPRPGQPRGPHLSSGYHATTAPVASSYQATQPAPGPAVMEAPSLPPPRTFSGPAPVSVEKRPATWATPPTCGTGRRPGWWQRCKARMQNLFLGYPEEFEPPPFGESVRMHNQTQVANGEAARMVFYDFDFISGGEGLNLRGRDKLAQVAHLLPQTFYPIIVQRTPGWPELAESRRTAVLHELARGPFPVPPERVVIGPSIAIGLSGVEAEIVNQNMLQNTQNMGPPVTGTLDGGNGGGGFGGTGGFGVGGGGSSGR